MLSSTNHHGVHSPFIYAYVTKCLYAQPKFRKKKTEHILLRSIGYFEAKKVLLANGGPELKNKIKTINPSIVFKGMPYDLLFVSISDAKRLKHILSSKVEIHNDSILLVDGIHQNKTNETQWGQLLIQCEARITIDLFHCGLIFFRNEQAPEHFKIRI